VAAESATARAAMRIVVFIMILFLFLLPPIQSPGLLPYPPGDKMNYGSPWKRVSTGIIFVADS
jgi:hypothetical protein